MRTNLARLHNLRQFHSNISVAFDIGAYRGEFTYELKIIWPGCRVWQFEADERQSKHLDKPFIGILGNEVGKEVKFYTLPEDKITTGSSIFKENTQHYANPVVVTKTMTTIDELAKTNDFSGEWSKSGLIKIDTQGSELIILQGATNFITKNNPRFILLETSFVPYNEGAPLFHDTINYMSSIGYRVYDMYGDFYSENGRLMQSDVLFEKAL